MTLLYFTRSASFAASRGSRKNTFLKSVPYILLFFFSSHTWFKPSLFGRLLPSVLFYILIFKNIARRGKVLQHPQSFSSTARYVCLWRQTVIEEPGIVYCDWFVFPLLLPTPTILFSLNRKRRSRKRNGKKIENRCDSSDSDSDSAYDSNFWFSLDHKCSYDYDSDSVASGNHP